MERITKPMLQAALNRYIDTAQVQGDIYLDNNPIYGGWTVLKRGECGTESPVFTHARMAAKELYHALNAAETAVRNYKAENPMPKKLRSMLKNW